MPGVSVIYPSLSSLPLFSIQHTHIEKKAGIVWHIPQSDPVLYCLIIHLASQCTVKIALGFVNNPDVHHKGGSLKIVFRMSWPPTLS